MFIEILIEILISLSLSFISTILVFTIVESSYQGDYYETSRTIIGSRTIFVKGVKHDIGDITLSEFMGIFLVFTIFFCRYGTDSTIYTYLLRFIGYDLSITHSIMWLVFIIPTYTFLHYGVQTGYSIIKHLYNNI